LSALTDIWQVTWFDTEAGMSYDLILWDGVARRVGAPLTREIRDHVPYAQVLADIVSGFVPVHVSAQSPLLPPTQPQLPTAAVQPATPVSTAVLPQQASELPTLLSSLALTEADIPRGFSLNSAEGSTSGPMTLFTSYFTRVLPRDNTDRGLIIINIVAGSSTGDVARATGILDTLMSNFQSSLARGEAAVVSEGGFTDLGSVPVGDESRAAAASVRGGPIDAQLTIVVFRRGQIVSAVALVSAGTEASLDEPTRLSRIVDGRISALRR
jgi:hypothetical protein